MILNTSPCNASPHERQIHAETRPVPVAVQIVNQQFLPHSLIQSDEILLSVPSSSIRDRSTPAFPPRSMILRRPQQEVESLLVLESMNFLVETGTISLAP